MPTTPGTTISLFDPYPTHLPRVIGYCCSLGSCYRVPAYTTEGPIGAAWPLLRPCAAFSLGFMLQGSGSGRWSCSCFAYFAFQCASSASILPDNQVAAKALRRVFALPRVFALRRVFALVTVVGSRPLLPCNLLEASRLAIHLRLLLLVPHLQSGCAA
jgi:hypothetical protein